MIIPLTHPPKSSPDDLAPALPSALARLGSSELCLLELQGKLEVSGDKHGQLVGRLTIDDDMIDGKGKPTLRIGHHLLEGKIVNLPKPLAILQRTSPQSRNMSDGDGNAGVQCLDNRDTKGGNKSPPPAATSYAIRTVVRKKIVFSRRPTPMVGLSAKTSC